MKNKLKLLKLFREYVKHRKVINELYGWHLKNNPHPPSEEGDWKTRTKFYKQI